MTKAERLQELKMQEQFFKVLDKEFDKGWREFVNKIRKQTTASNERLYKALAAIKGQSFVNDIKGLMKAIKKEYSLLRIVRNPVGIEFNDSRFSTIPKIWVQQKSGSCYADGAEGGVTGSLCIQIKNDRWIKIDYQD